MIVFTIICYSTGLRLLNRKLRIIKLHVKIMVNISFSRIYSFLRNLMRLISSILKLHPYHGNKFVKKYVLAFELRFVELLIKMSSLWVVRHIVVSDELINLFISLYLIKPLYYVHRKIIFPNILKDFFRFSIWLHIVL